MSALRPAVRAVSPYPRLVRPPMQPQMNVCNACEVRQWIDTQTEELLMGRATSGCHSKIGSTASELVRALNAVAILDSSHEDLVCELVMGRHISCLR